MSKPPRNVVPIRAHLREAGEAAPPRGSGFLPDNCPVTPLGIEGLNCWFLSAAGTCLCVPTKSLNKLTIRGLFGVYQNQIMTMKAEWAKVSVRARKMRGGGEEEVVTPVDFKPDVVAGDLIAACNEIGPFSPVGTVRGRGVWRGADDDLVVHHGNEIEVGGRMLPPGIHDHRVYARGRMRPRPAREAQPAGDSGPAAVLLSHLARWNWQRPDVDARLVLGWVAASFYAGALEWRPHAWVTGPRAAGKSTLFRLIARVLHEPAGCVLTGDTTPAGVRSHLGDDALAVLFDDAEAGEQQDRIRNLVVLARAASTGSLALRGTSEHGTASFTVRFTGFFNSILRPALTAQDLSRLMLLNLKPLDRGSAPPPLGTEELGLLGRMLFRRMLDNWRRFQRELPLWRAALEDAGMRGRASEQFGIVLAAASVALHDGDPHTDEMADIAEACAAGTASDRAEEMAEWERCLERITSTIVPAYRGGSPRTLGSLIATAAMMQTQYDETTGNWRVADFADRHEADRTLQQYGLRMHLATEPGDKRPLRRWKHLPDAAPSPAGDGRAVGHLAVANTHATLNAVVFARTHLAAASGTSGGWKAALETAPGAQLGREMRFAGPASRCVLVPLDLVLDLGGTNGEAVE